MPAPRPRRGDGARPLHGDVDGRAEGATSVDQLEENLGALDVLEKLTPEAMELIEGILANKPHLVTVTDQ